MRKQGCRAVTLTWIHGQWAQGLIDSPNLFQTLEWSSNVIQITAVNPIPVKVSPKMKRKDF